jgi:hypothetical protein
MTKRVLLTIVFAALISSLFACTVPAYNAPDAGCINAPGEADVDSGCSGQRTVDTGFIVTGKELVLPEDGIIDVHPTMKPGVRAILLPAVCFGIIALDIPLGQKMAILVALLLFGALLIIWIKTKRIMAKD